MQLEWKDCERCRYHRRNNKTFSDFCEAPNITPVIGPSSLFLRSLVDDGIRYALVPARCCHPDIKTIRLLLRETNGQNFDTEAEAQRAN